MSDADNDVPLNGLRAFLKAVCPPFLVDAARSVKRRVNKSRVPETRRERLPDEEFYRPHFSPWEGLGGFKDVMATVRPYSTVSADRVWILYTLAQQALHLRGNFWECGVYKGGTALVLARAVSSVPGKQLRLFDTFSGLPGGKADRDFTKEGGYADTSLDIVKGVVGSGAHIVYHPGLIPETFQNLESEQIAFAHVDAAQYQSIFDCCSFIYPRLVGGGFIVFDDYGFRSCPGARAAVDEFFADKPERPLVLPTRQAIVTKLPEEIS